MSAKNVKNVKHDQFGSRMGTKAHKINVVFAKAKGPMTAAEVAEAAKVRKARAEGRIGVMVANKMVKKVGKEKYAVVAA